MRLTGKQVEAAFVATVREQVSGQAFDWERVADHLNESLAAGLTGRDRRFLLGAQDDKQ